ncbi:MAG: hypothetical protein FJX74_07775, partial [Armatimonadetes bacterium]|nr:hypothetical protein [Armatimonadota bacterium]
DGSVRVWCAATGQCLRQFDGDGEPIAALAVLPDGCRAVAAGDDGVVRVWDLRGGSAHELTAGLGSSPRAPAVSPDGRRLAMADHDGALVVLDLETGRRLTRFCTDGALSCCAVGGTDVMVAGDEAADVYFLRLEDAGLGPPILTAWRAAESGSLAFGCLHCKAWPGAPESALGAELPCPSCGQAVKLNPFVIEADWRPVAEAWKGRGA